MYKLKVSDVFVSENYRPAFKTLQGGHIEYDLDLEEWVKSEEVIENKNIFYEIPIPYENLKEGDFIRFNNLWVRIVKINRYNEMIVEKIHAQERIEVIVTQKNYHKLFSLIDFLNGEDINSFKEEILPLLLNDNPDLIPIIIMLKGENKVK